MRRLQLLGALATSAILLAACGGGTTGGTGGSGNAGNSGGAGGSTGGAGGSTGGTGGSTGGTGGSTGECVAANDCDDGDACTVDACDVDVCTHTPIDPDDNNACTTDACDPATGVSNTPIDPNDNDACTTDACDPATGVSNKPIDRDDMDACTFDACESATGPINLGEVVFFTEDFADNAAGWTLGTDWAIGPAVASAPGYAGSADPGEDHSPSADNGLAGIAIGGNVPKVADNMVAYLESPVIDTSAAAGAGLELRAWRFANLDFAPYMTNTVEVFDGAQWQVVWTTGDQAPIVDSDVPGFGDGWFPLSFDVSAYAGPNFRLRFGFNVGNADVYAIGGPSWDDVTVLSVPYPTDADQCTVAACDPATGGSLAPYVPKSDGVACTVETCDANGIRHVADNAACNDNDPCTDDVCDVELGCVNPPKNVDDGNLCTIDTCDPATGNAVNTPKNVSDNNSCTADTCDPATGNPVNTPNPIPGDNNLCTTDSCDPANGMSLYTPKPIPSDNNLCTVDGCNPATGAATYTPKNCSDNNACTLDTCAAGTGNCSSATPTQPHDKCVTGPNATTPFINTVGCTAGAQGVISKVCASDPFCCNTDWDSLCVGEVYSNGGSKVCAASNGTCAHNLCVTGTKLTAGCDSAFGNCATLICNVDSFCCNNQWDSLCVDKVTSVCQKNCF